MPCPLFHLRLRPYLSTVRLTEITLLVYSFYASFLRIDYFLLSWDLLESKCAANMHFELHRLKSSFQFVKGWGARRAAFVVCEFSTSINFIGDPNGEEAVSALSNSHTGLKSFSVGSRDYPKFVFGLVLTSAAQVPQPQLMRPLVPLTPSCLFLQWSITL